MDEKDFDFDNLTREQALYLHKKLWNTIADMTLKLRKPIEKWEIFRLYGWPRVKWDCWCCKYCNSWCTKCPIEWGYGKFCDSIYSPYLEWKKRLDYYHCYLHHKDLRGYHFEELAKYAREIANLPERKG